MTDLLRRYAAGTLLLACAADAGAPALAAQASPSSDAPLFSADVIVERTTVDREDVVVERMPKVRYRLNERLGSGGVTTEIVFQNTPPFPGRGPLTDPSAGFKVSINEQDGISVVDPQGKVVSTRAATSEQGPLTGPALQRRNGASPSLLLERSTVARRQALVARFGSPVGRHGKHDRFVRNDQDTFEEVLVDPDAAVPTEINTLRSGRLVHRSVLAYQTLPDGRIYCSSRRDESVIDPADESALRNVTTTTYTPVTGGGR
jgi:hypothetical protein